MIDDMEIIIQNLKLRFKAFSNVKGNFVCLALEVPLVNIEIDPNENDPSQKLRKLTFPEEFKLSLQEPELEGKIKTTMIADGVKIEGVGSENVAPSSIKFLAQKSTPTSVHYFVDAAIRSFRAVIDPITLQTIIEILDLYPAEKINEINNTTNHFNPPSTHADDLSSKNQENNPHHHHDDEIICEDDFKEAEEFESSEELEFEDCDEFVDPDDDVSASAFPNEVFVSFLPQTQSNNEISITYDVRFSIKQATLTLLTKDNPIASDAIFHGTFDLNKLIAPPYTPFDHTTFYLADLHGKADQSTSYSLEFKLNVQACGITQFLFTGDESKQNQQQQIEKKTNERWWDDSDFKKTDILSFQQTCDTEKPIISILFTQQKLLPKKSECTVQLGEIKLVINDQVLPRFLPYIQVINALLSSSNGSDQNSSSLQAYKRSPPPPKSYDEYETEMEQNSDKSKFSIQSEAISLCICSSNPDALESILFDLEALDIYSDSSSDSTSQEWLIRFNKFTASINRGYGDIVWFFDTRKIARVDAFRPISITFDNSNKQNQQQQPIHKKPQQNQQQNQQQQQQQQTTLDPNIHYVDDYDTESNSDFKKHGFIVEDDEDDDPFPYKIDPHNFFEGKSKNPKISSDLQNFFEKASSNSSIRIVIQLPHTSIDITKENYDLLTQVISEITKDFTKSLEQSTSSPSSDNTSSSSSSEASSITCKLQLINGTIVLRENLNSNQSKSMEDERSRFDGNFKNLQFFYASNYLDNSYLCCSLDCFDLIDNSPQLPPPGISIIEKHFYPTLDSKMLSLVYEISKKTKENIFILDLSDILIEYSLNSDYINRLQAFFTNTSSIDENHHDNTSNNPYLNPNINQYNDDQDQNDLEKLNFYINIQNICVKILPSTNRKEKFSLLIYMDEMEGFNEKAFISSISNDIYLQFRSFRESFNIYLLDDISHLPNDISNHEKIKQMTQDDYLRDYLGYRKILEMFLHIHVKMNINPQFSSSSTPPFIVTMKENRATAHLCNDSFQELLKVYADFAFSSASSSSSSSEDEDDANQNDESEKEYFDPSSEIRSSANQFISSMFVEDYNPSTQMTQLNKSSETDSFELKEGEQIKIELKKEEKEEENEEILFRHDYQENLPPPPASTSAAASHVNPFDGETDSPFDGIELEPDSINVDINPEWENFDTTKQYVVLGVDDISKIPTNAYRLPSQFQDNNNFEDDDDDEYEEIEEEYEEEIEIDDDNDEEIIEKPKPAKPLGKTITFDSDDDDDDEDSLILSHLSQSKVTKPIKKKKTITIKKTRKIKVKKEKIKKPTIVPELKKPTISKPNHQNLRKLDESNNKEENKIKIQPQKINKNNFKTLNNKIQEENSIDDVMDEFEVVSLKEKKPITRIRNDLVDKIKSNQENIEKLDYFLGIPIQYGYERKRKMENLMELPENYPKSSFLIQIIDLSVTINLYDGKHWSKDRQDAQSKRNKIEISLKGFHLNFFTFSLQSQDNQKEKIMFRMGCKIKDIEILDKLEASNRNLLLYYDSVHLRAMDSYMINILLQQKAPISMNRPTRALLHLFILPIRLNIDQDARYFLTNFLTTNFPDLPPSSTIYEEIRFSDIHLQLDYKAKRMESMLDFTNLCPINNAKFAVDGQILYDVVDMGDTLKKLIWDKLGSLILNAIIGLGPLSPFVNVAKGFGSLFISPYQQYRSNGRIFRGVREGISIFGFTLASESLNIGSKLASGSQMALQFTDDCFNSLRPESSRINENSRHSHPENAADGVQQGFSSIKRETETAFKHLFVIPVEQYNTKGTGSAIGAAFHAIPIAVLRPAIGIAEGAKHIGRGACNQIGAKETKTIYKK